MDVKTGRFSIALERQLPVEQVLLSFTALLHLEFTRFAMKTVVSMPLVTWYLLNHVSS